MAAAQPSSPAPSSPDLEGYNSALEEVNTPRRRQRRRPQRRERRQQREQRQQQQDHQDTAAARVLDWSQSGACEGACGYATCAGRPRAVYEAVHGPRPFLRMLFLLCCSFSPHLPGFQTPWVPDCDASRRALRPGCVQQ
jgi:hypothetical protein